MRSRLLVRFLAALLLTWPGLTFFGRRGQSSSDAVDALVKDLQALGSAGQDSVSVVPSCAQSSACFLSFLAVRHAPTGPRTHGFQTPDWAVPCCREIADGFCSFCFPNLRASHVKGQCKLEDHCRKAPSETTTIHIIHTSH